MKCVNCNQQIISLRNAWNEVKGWEKPREQGGTNHIALREPTGRFMCKSCMINQQAGISTEQIAL